MYFVSLIEIPLIKILYRWGAFPVEKDSVKLYWEHIRILTGDSLKICLCYQPHQHLVHHRNNEFAYDDQRVVLGKGQTFICGGNIYFELKNRYNAVK